MGLDGADALIDGIYEAAFVPELWPQVLDAIGSVSGSVGGLLFTTDRRQVTRWTASVGLRPLVEGFVGGDWMSRNPRLSPPAWVDGTTSWVREIDFLTPEEIDGSAMYRELVGPLGYWWYAGTAVILPTGDVAVFDVERRRDQGPLSRGDVDRLDGMRPHLARSAIVATRLGLERARAAVETLSVLGLPAAVLNRGGRAIAANDLFACAGAQASIGAFDRVAFARPAIQALFQASLAELAGQGRASVSFPIPAVQGLAPAVAHLVPVRGLANDIFTGGSAILILTPLAEGAPPSPGLLTGLFDLTPAEARVARGIAAGQTVETLAASLGTSPATIRTQLRAVLGKTGVNRQADLVRLLVGVAPRAV